MSLREYRKKRHFTKTKEPGGAHRKTIASENIFVVQEHHARRLHWDFRLAHNGVLKSWAVTNEPSDDPAVKRLAVETEDHPLEYAKFHGTIPAGEYGAGKVRIWDRGKFEPYSDLGKAIEKGVIEVTLKGKRLKGRYVLVRTAGDGPKASWLFFKGKPKPAALKIPPLESILNRKKRAA